MLYQQAMQPCVVYLWVKDASGTQVTRFHTRLLAQVLGEFREDSGTGSACANLGTWLAQYEPDCLPMSAITYQGDYLQRLNCLYLKVDEQQVCAGGEVKIIGKGCGIYQSA